MIHWLRHTAFIWLLAIGVLCGVPGRAGAAAEPAAAAPSAKVEASPPQVAPDSPRAAVEAYLELCRAGRFEEAARYLDVPEAQRARAGELAERLKLVLDRRVLLDPSGLSPNASGREGDGLPASEDEIAKLRGPNGQEAPVLLVRRPNAKPPRWVFSRSTVARIDDWYHQLEQRWLYEHLPKPLLRSGPVDMPWWQWLAIPLLVLVAWVVGMVAARLTRAGLARVVDRTSAEWDDALLGRTRGPLTLGWALIAAMAITPLIGFHARAEALLDKIARAGLLLAFFWALFRALDILSTLVSTSAWTRDSQISKALVPLATRVAKLLVWAIAAVAMLAQFGYPVASLIAGLGIGGLAVALAAQKTVENLFGAFSIAADQPFREGDFVRIEDFVGTVEAIGLRSTRIRTLDRTVISIPNGKLAEMRLESFTARDRIRLYTRIALVYQTTQKQLEEVLAGFERVLREQEKLWTDSLTVRLEAFGESALYVEIMAWFNTQDFDEFKAIRERVLLGFMGVVERAGTAFAVPARAIHLGSGSSPGPGMDPRGTVPHAAPYARSA